MCLFSRKLLTGSLFCKLKSFQSQFNATWVCYLLSNHLCFFSVVQHRTVEASFCNLSRCPYLLLVEAAALIENQRSVSKFSYGGYTAWYIHIWINAEASASNPTNCQISEWLFQWVPEREYIRTSGIRPESAFKMNLNLTFNWRISCINLVSF